ncbi:MAG TPA: MFS transporter [Stellaceae bacterium]|jgi:predicted MFS family arabinose efflux permease|nr:MFS transporter [Stellaceae bacterium]
MRKAVENRWWVVFGCFIALMVNNGVVSNFTFSVFLKPVTEDLGWGRATITSAMFLAGVVAAFVTPVVGKLMDVYGVQRITFPGLILYALLFASFSLLQPSLLMLYAIAGTAAIAGHVQTPMGYSKVISSRFEDHRGIALGIAVSGVGLGTVVMPQIAQFLIAHLGWRLAYVGVGITVLIFALPMVYLFLGEPSRSSAERAANASLQPGPIASAIIKGDKRFYLLLFMFFFSAIAINGTITHIVATMTDRGYTPAVATSVLSTAGAALIVGRLISGYCLDRIHGPYVATVFFLLAASGIALITSGVGGLPMAFAGTVLCGMGLGAEGDLLGYFVSRYFGLRSFGTIYGFMIGIFSLGNGVGPFLMGLSYDNTHSYLTAALGFEVLLLICCGLVLCLGAYTFPARRHGAGAAVLAEAKS